MDVSTRAGLLYKLAEAIESKTDQLLRAEIADTGKPISLASGLDIPCGGANFRVFIDMVKATHEASYQSSTPDGRGALNYTLRRPKGVIAVICPWNLPFLNVTWKLGPALALGNTVVVKPSEETPTTATMLAQIAKDVGIPDGVINIAHIWAAPRANFDAYRRRRCHHVHRRNTYWHGNHESRRRGHAAGFV